MRQLFIISLIMIGGCIPCFGLSIDEISGEWKTDFDRTWRDLMQNPQMKTKSAQEIAAAKEMVRQVVAALRVTISPTQLHVAEHGTAKAIRVVRFESLSASAGGFTVMTPGLRATPISTPVMPTWQAI